jgi:MFS family permease
VLAASIGFSFHSLMAIGTGVFMDPLGQEFGWNRAQQSSGVSIASITALVLSPFFGALIDRWGVRRLAIPGLVLTSLAVASFALTNGSMTQWFALWTVYALVSLAVKSTVWTAAVAGVFSASRGLAIGVTLGGTAIAQIIAPPLANWLIADYGWRAAFFWLGIGWGSVALILSQLFLFDAHDRKRQGLRTASGEAIDEPPPLTGAEHPRGLARPGALADRDLDIRHDGADGGPGRAPVPVAGRGRDHAGKRGVPRQPDRGCRHHRQAGHRLAARSLSAELGGRRNPGLGGHRIRPADGAHSHAHADRRCHGDHRLCLRTKLQICGYLTTRYGGMRNFGKIFGTMASIIALGSGLGPVLGGLVYDMYGSYTPFLLAGVAGSLLSGFLIFGLGRYPVWEQQAQAVHLARARAMTIS